MTTRLLVPIRGADPGRRPSPEAGLDGVTPVVEGGALLAFSGVEAVRRWRETARFVAVPQDGIEGLARRAGAGEIVQDVAGPVRTKTRVDAAAEVAAPPYGLRGLAAPLDPLAVGRLREVSSRHPAIERMWVVEATIDGSDVVVAAFQVEAGHEDAGALVRSLTPEVVPSLPVDLYEGVQLVVLTDDEVAGAVRASDEPIYERS